MSRVSEGKLSIVTVELNKEQIHKAIVDAAKAEMKHRSGTWEYLYMEKDGYGDYKVVFREITQEQLRKEITANLVGAS